MITIYNRKVKQVLMWMSLAVVISMAACKKGTFDINSPNPNSLSPASVGPKYYLSSSLAGTANLMYGGINPTTGAGLGSFAGADLLNTWMGYWSASGGFTPSPVVVSYQLVSTTGAANWDNAYLNLKNYNVIETLSASDPTLGYYSGISKIMQAFVFQRVVDLYNNAPYIEAFSSTNTAPNYDKGSDIYKSLIAKIDSSVAIINATNANTDAENPEAYDVMFGGDMDLWVKFANTLKLKLLMRLTQTADGSAMATSGLAGLTSDSFLGPGEDAGVNPGYSNASNTQENPYYLNVSKTVTGAAGTNANYWRANSYAVDFYKSNNDLRAGYFYAANKTGEILGRKVGSSGVGANEGNDFISGVNGPGNAKSETQDAVILGAFESYFLQAEAITRGYLTGDAKAAYKSGVTASFSLLGAVIPPIKSVIDPTQDSITYTPAVSASYFLDSATNKNNPNVNWDAASNKITLIITQKWAACNSFDPLESYSDWRRLGIPINIPVSDYPGSQATHIPYRLLYPDSESSYNAGASVKEGNIDIMTSKIFWMP